MTSGLKWRFSPKRPSDKTRDPVVAEFFSSDAIKDAGEALVREAIQNSLDARADRVNGKARIRIFISGDEEALQPESHEFWFESAWPHYEAPKNGLRPHAIGRTKKCRFLVFEDFETTGLIGNREQYEQEEGKENPFFYFFRAEGTTEKDKDRLGRWGIGKQVFPRSSQAQSFFGYTETNDGGFLMGGSILKHHSVGGKTYKPDGFFGLAKKVADDELTVPTSDQAVLERFRKDFKIERKSGQHGLSVVVPWLDESEGDESLIFDKDTLGLAVIEDYFAPIIEGRLEVELSDPDGSMKIFASNYAKTLDTLEASANEKRKKEIRRVRSHIDLAEAARADIKMFALPPCSPTKAAWGEDMVTEDLAKEVRELLAQGKPVGITATLTVRPKGQPPSTAHFNCYFRKADQVNDKPCHIRENLIISDVESSRVSGFSCLIRVDPGPLAELLGDSENPAHTEWQQSSRNFKDKYTYGGLTIEFVSNFASNFLRRVYSNSKQLDRKLLIDLFSDSGPENTPEPQVAGQKGAKKPKAVDDGIDPPPPPTPPAPKPGVRVNQLADGFNVLPNTVPPPPGSKVKVEVAYEVTRGSALKAYRDFDFKLAETIGVETDGCKVLDTKPNVLVVEVQDSSKLGIRIKGFDVNRDLYVRTTVQLPKSAADVADGDEEEAQEASPVEV
jgi:hypothetical protein